MIRDLEAEVRSHKHLLSAVAHVLRQLLEEEPNKRQQFTHAELAEFLKRAQHTWFDHRVKRFEQEVLDAKKVLNKDADISAAPRPYPEAVEGGQDAPQQS